jgi:hypothetical protein
MHECLSGTCEAQLGPIICPVWPSLSRPYHMTAVCVRTPPLSLILEGIVSLLNRVQCHNPQYPESLSHGPVEVWLVLIHQHHPLRHLPSSTTHEKEKAKSYFRLSLSLVSVRSLSCLELFSNSHVRVFCHQASGPTSCLTIMRTIGSEWTWVW